MGCSFFNQELFKHLILFAHWLTCTAFLLWLLMSLMCFLLRWLLLSGSAGFSSWVYLCGNVCTVCTVMLLVLFKQHACKKLLFVVEQHQYYSIFACHTACEYLFFNYCGMLKALLCFLCSIIKLGIHLQISVLIFIVQIFLILSLAKSR